MSKDLDNLAGSFRALGWNEKEIKDAVNKVNANPKKFTVVMPEHYKHEADLHAKNTCKYIFGLKENSKEYKACYDHHFHEYLTEAYNNSKGIEEGDNDDTIQANPTTPRAEAAFQASIVGGAKSPYQKIIKKYNESNIPNVKLNAEKFKSTLKAAGLTLTHLYLKAYGALEAKAPNMPERGIYTPTSSYAFAKEMSKLSVPQRDKKVRDIGHNNFMRQIILLSIIKVLEPVFAIDYDKLTKLTKEKCAHLPSSVYNDRHWLDNFAKNLEVMLRSDLKDINMEQIILNTFIQIQKKEEAQPAPVATPPPAPKNETKKEAPPDLFGTPQIKPTKVKKT